MLEASTGHRAFLRDMHAETLLENFFVAAIASVLVTRLYLHFTGYPQIGIGGYHIAHVLWGGLLMLVAIVMSLAFLNRLSKEIAAIIGGVGFGMFVDELGKFVTSDNNYFFRPTVALIYVIFVLLYFAIRFIGRQRVLSDEERVAAVFEIVKETGIHKIRPEEQQLALSLLKEYPEGNFKMKLEAILSSMPQENSRGMSLTDRLKKSADRSYGYVVTKWWFGGAVIGFFAFVSIASLYALVIETMWSTGLALEISGAALLAGFLFLERRSRLRNMYLVVSAIIIVVSILVTWSLRISLNSLPLSFLDWTELVSPSLSGIITVSGLLLMPISRLRAYHLFRLSVLISIFLTQVVAFYQAQFLALIGLIFNILILLTLRYLINKEEGRLTKH